MEFKSTNGKFTISVPDETITTNEKIQINLKCLERGVSLWNLADTISKDLFCSNEVDLKGKTIECWVANAKGEGYNSPFVVDFRVSMAEVLSVIAGQWIL